MLKRRYIEKNETAQPPVIPGTQAAAIPSFRTGYDSLCSQCPKSTMRRDKAAHILPSFCHNNSARSKTPLPVIPGTQLSVIPGLSRNPHSRSSVPQKTPQTVEISTLAKNSGGGDASIKLYTLKQI
jgi:hypothetical protein